MELTQLGYRQIWFTDSCNQVINLSRLGKITAISTDDIFKCIFLNEKVWISIKLSLKFVFNGWIKQALVHIIACLRKGDKPLPEPTFAQFIAAYIYGAREKLINLYIVVDYL